MLTHNSKEAAKLWLRTRMLNRDLAIGRDPHPNRLVRTLEHYGLTSVIDVGANVGQFASLLRAAGFTGRIISVEPLNSAFAELSRRASKDDNWQVFHGVMAAEANTELVMNVSENSYSSSILEVNQTHLAAAPESKVVATQAITSSTVANLVTENNLNPSKTLLKVDTQGYEEPVLLGAGDLTQYAAIQLELSYLPLYEGQKLATDLIQWLADADFELFSLEPGIAGADGRMLQADGLFINRSLLAE